MSLTPTPRLSGRTRTAVALVASASTFAIGAGFAASADAAPATKTVKQTVKAKTAKPHARTKAYFNLAGSYAVGAKSSWSVDFGDGWKVQSTKAKATHPAWVWHSYASAGKKVVHYTVTDAKGVKHTTMTTVAVAAAAKVGAVPADVTAAVGLSLNKTYNVTHNGKVVSIVAGLAVDGSAVVSVTATVSLGGSPASPAPTTAAPTTAAPTTAAPTTSAPTTVPPTTTAPTTAPPTTSAPTTAPPTTTPTVTSPSILSTSIAGLQLGGGNITTVDIYGTGFQPGAVLLTPQVTTCSVLLFCAANPFGYTSATGVVGQMTYVSSTDLRIMLTVPNSLLGGVSYAFTVQNPDNGTSNTYSQGVASIL